MDTPDIIEILGRYLDGSVDQWERASKTACYSGARACRGKLGGFHTPKYYPMNFMWVEVLEVPNIAAALISRSGPFVALSETTPGYFNDLVHTSNVEFANAVEATRELHFLGTAILDKDLDPEDREKFSQLNRTWRYNMKHWKPKTLGQALFNCWD